jgi:hypothetical protein
LHEILLIIHYDLLFFVAALTQGQGWKKSPNKPALRNYEARLFLRIKQAEMLRLKPFYLRGDYAISKNKSVSAFWIDCSFIQLHILVR